VAKPRVHLDLIAGMLLSRRYLLEANLARWNGCDLLLCFTGRIAEELGDSNH
jgi:hypothetical protein